MWVIFCVFCCCCYCFYLKYEFIKWNIIFGLNHPVNLKISCFPGILLGFEIIIIHGFVLLLLFLDFSTSYICWFFLMVGSFTPVVCSFYIVISFSAKGLFLGKRKTEGRGETIFPISWKFYILSASCSSLLSVFFLEFASNSWDMLLVLN